MTIQRYSVNQHPVQTLLTWIESRRDCDPRDPAPVRLECGEGARFHRLALFRLPGWLSYRVAQPVGPIEGWNGVEGKIRDYYRSL